MKKLLFIFIFFLINTSAYSNNIVFLDVQYIIEKSEIGIFYKNKIKIFKEKKLKDIISQENEIKDKENEIKAQKNILSKDKINLKVENINKLLKNYQNNRNKFNKEIDEQKKNYTSKILKILNPLITEYVEKNKITLVIDKKNILIGINNLDITNNILEILNKYTADNKLINNDEQ